MEGINRIFIDAKHPSSLNRFLTAGIWRQTDVNNDRIGMLKANGALAGNGWLLIDDTLTHKTGKEMEAVEHQSKFIFRPQTRTVPAAYFDLPRPLCSPEHQGRPCSRGPSPAIRSHQS